MADGIILMTALVPTTGHERLVRFAQDFLAADAQGGQARLFLLISTRSHEPTTFAFRAGALARGGGAVEVIALQHDDDDAPQNPSGPEDPGFWEYWRAVIATTTGAAPVRYVFASEPYGADVARVIGAQFIPVDVAREVEPARGSDVRADLFRRWRDIAPAARPALTTNWVLFGQESVGKTTLARLLSSRMGGAFFHEWARPYMEGHAGPGVTASVMSAIVRGQAAVEAGAAQDERILRFLDTDLLSTLGYYRLWGGEPDPAIWGAIDRSSATLRPRYLLISDKGVPFEPDPLRYGGDRRETEMGFWASVLEERGLAYHVIDAPSLEERYEQAREIILSAAASPGMGAYRDIIGFSRE